MKRYIGVDKLIKDLNDLSEHYTNKGKEYHPHIDFVIDTVNQQPAADVRENVKGEWGRTKNGFIYCSNCGKTWYENAWTDKWHYCPNCGAQMMRGETWTI